VAYSELARVQVANGDQSGARDTAERAVAAITSTDSADERLFGIPAAAIAQMRAGDLDGAAKTVELAENGDKRVLAHTALAVALERAGHAALAREAAARAMELAVAGIDEPDRGEMIVYAAWAQAVVGDPAGARRYAERLGRPEDRDGLLALIAEIQLEAGDIAGARATVDTIGDSGERSDNEAWFFGRMIRGIAVDPIAVFDAFLFEAETPLRAILMRRIALARAHAGEVDGARRSFEAAMQFAAQAATGDPVRGLSDIAVARASVGDLAGALESLDQAEQLAADRASNEGDGTIEEANYVVAMRSAISDRDSAMQLIGKLGGAEQAGVELLVAVALAKARLHQDELAAQYLDAAAASLPEDDDLSLVAAAYASLAETRLREGNRAAGRAAASRAHAIADSITAESKDRAIGMFFAAIALARTGDVERARDVADRIEKPAR
ncbi:MAG: hypothetical protein JSU82_07020, partial [Rhodospirillales bacterium]